MNPTASPLGSFPELSAMYQTAFQTPLSNANLQATSGQDQISIANQKAAQSASNYRQIQDQSGGFQFFDPTGKPISAAEFAAVLGKTPAEVLKNSENPVDIAFQQDAKDLHDYSVAKLQDQNDAEAQAKVKAVEATVLKNYGIDIAKLRPDQLIQAFHQAYPTVYNPTGSGKTIFGAHNAGVPGGQTFIPEATTSLVQNAGSGGNFSL